MRQLPPLCVPVELFSDYQPVVGHVAVSLWLNLRCAAHCGRQFDLSSIDKLGIRIDRAKLDEALDALERYGLLEYDAAGNFIVHDPLPSEAFKVRYGAPAKPAGARMHADARTGESHSETATALVSAGAATQSGLPMRPRVASRSPLSKRRRQAGMLRLVDEAAVGQEPVNEDMQAVIQIYHKRIGMIGPTQFEKLKFWVEEQGMEGAVVALAIEETVRSADVPRISYLEGILRNWYNDGIRTLADVQERRRASKLLSSDPPPHERHEGVPNASAYQSVSSELVAKWKELYPDEYDR